MTTTKTVYTAGYKGNLPEDIVYILNAAGQVAFKQAVIFDTKEEAERIVSGYGFEDRVFFKITVEQLP